MKRLIAFLLTVPFCFGQFPNDSRGIILTGLPAVQDNLLGPLIQMGASPWKYGDILEQAIADNMGPKALAQVPALGTALSGTVSWSQGTQTISTTADLRTPLAGQIWVAFVWDSIDGVGTGRALCPIQPPVTATTITCSENMNELTTSGAHPYLLPPPVVLGGQNIDFQFWTVEQPSYSWNYYDVAIGLYRLYYRTGNATYLTLARAYADVNWQWNLDHGYRRVYPRASAMISQFFRALDGHPERFPGLYNWITLQVPLWADNSLSPHNDNREAGYMLWDIALGAKTDPDLTRHTQYCSWLATYTNIWNTVQAPDGSWPEEEYWINQSYVSAPKAFSAPFLYQGAPWREAINVKSMEAAYESLSDPDPVQGCNNMGANTALAASTFTAITKAVTWQNNYGRNTVDRGSYYEVNSQSNDQASTSPATGTVSINRGSTSLLGASGTNWNSAGYCDGTHFIGFSQAGKVYKIASCTDNTHATLSVAFGLYGESIDMISSAYGIAPAASGICHSSATWCYTGSGDRNLTRTICGGIGWLYAHTGNPTYRAWSDECISATLGGPTAGPTGFDTIGSMTLPCSGPACDGYVGDTGEALPSCLDTGGVAPCMYGITFYTNLGKNFGEAFGAPGIDNELGWRNWFNTASVVSVKATVPGQANR